MDEGFIKLYRKLLHSSILLDAEALQVFIYFLLRARHQKGSARMNGQTVMLEPGQLITGRFVLSEALGLTPAKVRRIISLLKEEQQINQQAKGKYSIITIVNWSEYQGNNQQTTSRPPADNQQTATNKNEKNGENDKKEPLDSDGCPTMEMNFGEEKKPKKAKPIPFSPPDWIEVDAWAGLLEIRRQKKTPNTERALRGILRELEKIRAAGHDPNVELDRATTNGWKTVYMPMGVAPRKEIEQKPLSPELKAALNEEF